MTIAVLGFQQHKWPSVERTRLFYERALSSEFKLRIIPEGREALISPVPDLVLNFTGRAGWEMNPRLDCPLAFALHGGPVLDYNFLAKRLAGYRDTDLFLVNCSSDEAILRLLIAGEVIRTARISLPIDLETFRPRDKASCRSLLPVTTDYLLGFVARLLPQKNLHGFLDILAETKARLAPQTVHGLVVGNYWLDYPVLPYCTAQYPALINEQMKALGIERDVTFLPASLTDEQLALCYAGMDVLVHLTSAIDENFGYAPVEAMGCGTPVVGAAYGGLKDTILDGMTGYLIPTWATPNGIRMDTATAVDRVTDLLTDKLLREQMSIAAASHAAKTWNEATCALTLRKAFRDTMRTGTSRASSPLRRASRKAIIPQSGKGGGLPEVYPSWEQYFIPVRQYVSGRPPVVEECSRFRLAGRVQIGQRGRVTLEDPAWPALYQLDKTDIGLVEIILERRTVEARTIWKAFPFEAREALDSRLQQLLDVGLLVGSKETS